MFVSGRSPEPDVENFADGSALASRLPPARCEDADHVTQHQSRSFPKVPVLACRLPLRSVASGEKQEELVRSRIAILGVLFGVLSSGCGGSVGLGVGDAAADGGAVDAEPERDAGPLDVAPPEDAGWMDADAGVLTSCLEGTWDHDGDPTTPCAAWSTCAAGTYVVQAPSATADRTCAPCANGYYSTAEDQAACTAGTCGVGTVQTIAGSSTTPATCAECAPGTWDHDADPATECAPWTTCAIGQKVVTIGTPSADRTCSPCGTAQTSANENAASCHPAAVAVVAGASHTCIALADGTVRCWGWNGWGQLGEGGQNDRGVPTAVSGLTNVVELSAGHQHTCARVDGGTVRCWGQYIHGSVDPAGGARYTPTVVANLTGAVELSAGRSHQCARLEGGTVRCWGYNFYGQLGDGTTISRPDPVEVLNVSGAVGLASGELHNCALLAGGKAICWGTNSYGQLGDGTTEGIRATPSAQASITGVAQMALGASYSCARLTDGTIGCWGRNEGGQLGSLTPAYSLLPVPAGAIANSVSIVANASHACAGLEDGAAVCWGNNNAGQLGYDGAMQASLPSVEGLSGVNQLALGGSHTCALVSGNVMCWGLNYFGQLGDGTQISRATPKSIVW